MLHCRTQLLYLFADTGFFGLDTDQDVDDATGDTLLVVYQPGLVSPIFLGKSEPKLEEAAEFYKTYLVAVARLLREYIGEHVQTQSPTDEGRLKEEVEAVVRLETRLWEISWHEEDLKKGENLRDRFQTVPFKEFEKMLDVQVRKSVLPPSIASRQF